MDAFKAREKERKREIECDLRSLPNLPKKKKK